MPLYEYQCASCHKVHEIIQKFSDAPMTDCPECGGQVSKLVSMSSFALKGTGWYTTDYKRKGASAESSSVSKAAKSEPASAAATPAPAASAAAPSASGPAPTTDSSKKS